MSHPASNTLTASRFMRDSYSAANGPEKIVSDMKNQERLAQQKGAVAWIEESLGRSLPYPDDFHRSLKDGIILCKVINQHRPGTIKLISTKDLPFCQMENISNFLKAARDLGLTGPDLFQTVDLYESKDLFQVSVTILTVARVLAGEPLPRGGSMSISKTNRAVRRTDAGSGGIHMAESAAPALPAKPPSRKGTIGKGSTIARNAGGHWSDLLSTTAESERTLPEPSNDSLDQLDVPIAQPPLSSYRRPSSSSQRTPSGKLTAATLFKIPTATSNSLKQPRYPSESVSEELLTSRADDAEERTMPIPTPESNTAGMNHPRHHSDNQLQPSTFSKSQSVRTSRPAPPPFTSSTHRVPNTTSSSPTPHTRPSPNTTTQSLKEPHYPPENNASASSDSESDEFDDGVNLNISAASITDASANAVVRNVIQKDRKGRDRSAGELDRSGNKTGSRNASREQVDVSIDGKVIAQYQLGNCIGKGQFGSVYRALNLETGQMVAIKRIRLEGLSDKDVEDLMKEVDLLKSLSHSSIVKYEGFAKADTCLNIILEYVENGSLLHTLKAFGNFPEKLVVSYTVKILEGLAYLHDKQVVHCDLKAANILTTKSGSVKLTDFGVSLNLQRVETEIGTVAGTPNWMAPEVILLEGASTASDIWSLGCTIIEFLTCRPPYSDLLAMTALFHIVEDECPPLPDTVSEHCKDFLRLCFKKDPKERPTALQLFDHPWIRKNWNGNKNMTVRHPTSTSRPPLIPSALQSPKSSREHRNERSDSDRSRSGSNVDIRASAISTKINVEKPLETDNIHADGGADSSVNGTAPFHHRFVKTSFGKTITCKICLLPCKKKAVMCEECGLICHKHCSPLALPTCGQQLTASVYSPTTSALLSPALSTESTISTTATDPRNSRGTTRSMKIKEKNSSRKVSSNHGLNISGDERFKGIDSPNGSVGSEISGVISLSELKQERLQRKSKQKEEECIIS